MDNREQIAIFFICLLISEIPVLIFTILDFLKLDCLNPYRIKYSTVHIAGQAPAPRPYPSNEEIIKALKISYTTFTKTYILPLIILFIFDWNIPFITMADLRITKLWSISYIIELFLTTVMSDICLYYTHRAFHKYNYLYQNCHKKHHQGYDMTFSAISHLFLDFESVMLAIGGVIPMLVFGTSLYIFLGYILFIQIGNAIAHSGYYLPCMPKYFPIFNSRYHDQHHQSYNCNYAAMYTWTDQFFGTLRID